MAQWLTSDDAAILANLWPDAPVDTEALDALLDAAASQCATYMPLTDLAVLAGLTELPARLVLAQIMQARALHRSGIATDHNVIGLDGLAVTVYPMDRTVKNLIRPRQGRPVIA